MTIRRTPHDFLVDELLTEEFSRALTPTPSLTHAHTVYKLTKTSLATPEAIGFFARALGVRTGLVDYAGLKDKHAHTTQHVSVPLDALAGREPPPTLSGWQGDASFLGYSPTPLSADCITGNRFTLVVRDLTRHASDEITRRSRLLTPPSDDGAPELLIVNYFGDQRFGSARHGQGWVATRLLAGDFEGALKLAIATPSRKDGGKTRAFTRLAAEQWGRWADLVRALPKVPERKPIEALAAGASFDEAFGELPYFLQAMCVEAHQSHLWNEIARRLAERIVREGQHIELPPVEKKARDGSTRLVPPPKPAMLLTEGLFGPMLFPPASVVTPQWRGLDLPTLAPSTKTDPLWSAEADEVLAQEGLTLKGLRIPRLRRPFYGEALRPLFVRATNFALSPMEADDLAPPARKGAPQKLKRTLSFDLPRGAYATVVLRALGQ